MTPALWIAAAAAEEVVLVSLEAAVDRAEVIAAAEVSPDGTATVTEVLHSDGVVVPDGLTLPCPACAPGPHLLGLDGGAALRALASVPPRWSIDWDFGGAHGHQGVDGAEILASGELITDPAAIRDAVRRRLAGPPTPGARATLWVDLSEGEVYRRTWSGSGVHLVVPPDPERLPMVLGWVRSGVPALQQRGASALMWYPDAGEAELRALLDAAPWPMSGAGGVPLGFVWRVREAAWLTLAQRRALPHPDHVTVEGRVMGW